MTNTAFNIAVLGGVEHKAEQSIPQRFVSISPIGGADLDLSRIDHDLTVTQISLVGGTKITVPAHANVDVAGLAVPGLLGRRRFRGTAGPDAPTVRVHRYGIFGAVKVIRNA
ncbi:hypothetical protein AB0L00_23805 [Actinoallomurus sp. NPDC052308]|uniref:hypothetical protein n=1 Tax=Actinoallomurus sp. NPDC052308 TaxID=3155530 RepID=UPI003441F9C6